MKKGLWIVIAATLVLALVLLLCLVIFSAASPDKNPSPSDTTAPETENTTVPPTGVSETNPPTDPPVDNSPLAVLLDTLFVPVADGRVARDWESFSAFYNSLGYEVYEDEGTYGIRDANGEWTLIGGDLTTRNSYIEVCSLTYRIGNNVMTESNAKVSWDDAGNPQYFIYVNEVKDTKTQVNSLDNVIAYIKSAAPK